MKRHESARIADRRRPEHEAADHGEDGGVGGNAESDGEDDGGYESGGSGKTPQAIGQILPQYRHGGFSVGRGLALIAVYGDLRTVVPWRRYLVTGVSSR